MTRMQKTAHLFDPDILLGFILLVTKRIESHSGIYNKCLTNTNDTYAENCTLI